jgi:hypothetical protein
MPTNYRRSLALECLLASRDIFCRFGLLAWNDKAWLARWRNRHSESPIIEAMQDEMLRGPL